MGAVCREEASAIANAFLRFSTTKFNLLVMALRCTDPRKRPEIRMSTIFMFVVLGLALRRCSFLRMDDTARLGHWKQWFGTCRKMVVSDSTLLRLLPRMDVVQLRLFLREGYVRWKEKGGYWTLASGRRIRLAVVDGSTFGKHSTSCFIVKADHGEYFLDHERWEKRGKELPCTTTLVERVLGFLQVDMIGGDGLYVSAPFWKACRLKKAHVYVKCKVQEADRLEVLRDARALFDASNSAGEIETAKGVDLDRNVSYEVQAAAGFQHAEYNGTVKVARIVEKRLKPLPPSHRGSVDSRPVDPVFWVISTDETMSAQDMRELGHLRWTIENQGFKMLNEHMKSKRRWTRGKDSEKTFDALLLMMFLSFNLIKAFERSGDVQRTARRTGGKKLTLHCAVEWILVAIADAAPIPDTA